MGGGGERVTVMWDKQMSRRENYLSAGRALAPVWNLIIVSPSRSLSLSLPSPLQKRELIAIETHTYWTNPLSLVLSLSVSPVSVARPSYAAIHL